LKNPKKKDFKLPNDDEKLAAEEKAR